jgi:hypothetical protein
VRTNQKKEWLEVSLGERESSADSLVRGERTWKCLLGHGIDAATGAVAVAVARQGGGEAATGTVAAWNVSRTGYSGHEPRAAAAATLVRAKGVAKRRRRRRRACWGWCPRGTCYGRRRWHSRRLRGGA